MALQRSQFVLNCGVNRSGDPPDTAVPSAARLLPKASDVGGAQALLTFDSVTDPSEFAVILEGTNMLDPSVPIDPNDPTIDPNALWLQATFASVSVDSTSSSPTSVLVNALTQFVLLVPFTFVRATIVLGTVESVFSEVANLDVNVNVKLDYITG